MNLADGDGFRMPASPELTAAVAGLSYVHVSRAPRRLQEGGPHQADRTRRILEAGRIQRITQIAYGLQLAPLPRRIQWSPK